MATRPPPIESSGLFRSAYRIRIGDGVGDKQKAGLTADNLISLTLKAQQKWPNGTFELRLIERDNGTFLEALRQKQSTLDKDAKAKWSYPEPNGNGALHARDQRRADAARLLRERGFMDMAGEGHGPAAYRASNPDSWKAAERGVFAAEVYQAVSAHLEAWATQQVQDKNGNGVRPALAAGPEAQPVVEPVVEQIQEPPRVDRQEQQARADRRARMQTCERAGVAGQQLKTASDTAQSELSDGLASIHLNVRAQRQQLAGRGGRVLRVDSGPQEQGQTRYVDLKALRRFNVKGAYASLAPQDRALNALNRLAPGVDLPGIQQALQAAEREVRLEHKDQVERLWTGNALAQAVLAAARGALDPLTQAQQSWADQQPDREDPGLHDQELRRAGAPRLVVQLLTLEHLSAVTHDPAIRARFQSQHNALSAKLVALAGTEIGELDTNALRDHLTAAREQSNTRGATGELQNFESAAASKQLKKQQRNLEQALQRQAELPKMESYLEAVEAARLALEAKAELRAERAEQQAQAAGQARPEPLHKVPTPPRDLSQDFDWNQLCDYMDAIGELRKARRAGEPGFGFDTRGPQAEPNRDIKVRSHDDAVVATKIVTTMRKLMESGLENTQRDRAVQVYVPAARPGQRGQWVQCSQSSTEVMGDKARRVAVAQLIELEMLIAHTPAADIPAVSRLLSLHGQIASHLQTSLADDVSEKAGTLGKWIADSKIRVSSLKHEFEAAARRPGPDYLAIIDRTRQLYEKALSQQYDGLVRMRQQAQARLDGASNGVNAGLALGFPPQNNDEALAWLADEDSDLATRQAASNHLVRQLSSGEAGASASERERLASALAKQLVANPESARGMPNQLRMLAAASNTEEGRQLRREIGTALSVALQAQKVILTDAELREPQRLLDHGRLVSAEELDAQLDDTIDEGRLALHKLRSAGDTESDLADTALMARRFKEATQAHFASPGERRPLASVLLIDNRHWVSLVAEREPNGNIRVSAVDTDTDQTPNWFNTVAEELKPGGLLDAPGPGMSVQLIKASLQEGLRPNACGPLQARLIQALQQGSADAPAHEVMQVWMGKRAAERSKTPEITWQLRADRAAMLQSSLEAGQALLEQNRSEAATIRANLSSYAHAQLGQLDALLSAEPPDPDQIREHLTALKDGLRHARQLLGDLMLESANRDDIVSAAVAPEIDQLEMLINLYGLQADQVSPDEALVDMQNAYGNVVNRNDASEIAEFKGLVRYLQQQHGVELLEPAQLKAEQQTISNLEKQVTTLTEDTLTDWVNRLLPDWGSDGGPGALGAYLKRYPQRAERLKLLSQAYERMALVRNDDVTASQGWSAEAHSVWSELANNPWVPNQTRELASNGASRTRPPDTLTLDPDQEANQGFMLEDNQASALRAELDEALRQAGLEHLILQDPDEPQVEILSAQELRMSQRSDQGASVADSQIDSGLGITDHEDTEIVAARKGFEDVRTVLDQISRNKSSKQLTTASGEPIKNLDSWAKSRESQLINSLFDTSKATKGFLSGVVNNTYGQFKSPPPLKRLLPGAQKLWQLGELMLLQRLRAGKTERADQIYQHFLSGRVDTAKGGLGDLKSSQMVQQYSPEQIALKGVEEAHRNFSQQTSSAGASLLQIPKIRRESDNESMLIPRQHKR